MVILILLRSMRGSGAAVLVTVWSIKTSTTTLFGGFGLNGRVDHHAVRGGLVVDQQLPKLHAGLGVHVLELTGRAVEHLPEVLVDLVRVDARQHLGVGDGGLLGLLAGQLHLMLLPLLPPEESRNGK